MFLDLNDKKGSNPLEIAAFLVGRLKPIWDSYRIGSLFCGMCDRYCQNPS